MLVKVADMGICANPTTQKTKNKQGIRRYIPECLTFDATLTNKVGNNPTPPCNVHNKMYVHVYTQMCKRLS